MSKLSPFFVEWSSRTLILQGRVEKRAKSKDFFFQRVTHFLQKDFVNN